MQNDLISRSALIEVLNKWADKNAERGYDTAYDLIREFIELVEERPCAYNVEKVVAELKKAEICPRCLNNKNTTSHCATFCDVGKKLEMVRNGGKE